MNVIGYINPNSMASEIAMTNTVDNMNSLGCTSIIYEERDQNSHNKWIEVLNRIDKGDVLIMNSLMDCFVSTTALRVFFERCINRGLRIILLKEGIDSKEEQFSKYLNTIINIYQIIRYGYRLRSKLEVKGKGQEEKFILPRKKRLKRDEKILNMYVSGYSIPFILKETKVSRGTVYKALKNHGLECDRGGNRYRNRHQDKL